MMDQCKRWFSAPVQQCVMVHGHSGPCKREIVVPVIRWMP